MSNDLTPVGLAVDSAERELAVTERELRFAAEAVTHRMERLLRALDEGRSVNELGELQGSALTLDLLCARRHEQAKALTTLRWVRDTAG